MIEDLVKVQLTNYIRIKCDVNCMIGIMGISLNFSRLEIPIMEGLIVYL